MSPSRPTAKVLLKHSFMRTGQVEQHLVEHREKNKRVRGTMWMSGARGLHRGRVETTLLEPLDDGRIGRIPEVCSP